MEENRNPIPENNPEPVPEVVPERPETLPQDAPNPVREEKFLAQGPEFAFCGTLALAGILLCNFLFFGGLHLAFGLMAAGLILCSWVYLGRSGYRFGRYEKALLILSLLICGGFGRTNDVVVKLVMLLFLFTAVNLALCIAAGQNRRDPQGAMSLLDAPRAFFRLGLGNVGLAGRVMGAGIRRGGAATRRIGAVGTGLLISLPILAIVIVLLTNADAAFEGLIDLLPEFELEEYLVSGFLGCVLAWILYSRGFALTRNPKPTQAQPNRKGANALTVNTVLIMVCLVYVVYLFSQLAYLSGGLSGILPEEYTMAQYARRGFFEMAWLCAINLGLICFGIWLIRGEKLPRMTKIAGTFIAAITLFLIVTASAKMFLYIGSYGLTWSRVTTEVTMLWLAITTLLITVRLFLPKFGYMKAVVLTAMVLGTLVFWVDVETLVAGYNVNAYRSGKLETVDVAHLDDLGAAAVPCLMELAEDDDPEIAQQARDILDRHNRYSVYDFRQWNYVRAKADRLLTDYHARQEAEMQAQLLEILGIDVSEGNLRRWETPGWRDGQRMLRYEFTFGEDREALVEQLKAANWEMAPLSPAMMSVLNRDVELFAEFRDVYLVRSDRMGYWMFADQHPEAEDPADFTQLLTRDSYRFTLAYYNSRNGTLYVFQVDKASPETVK